MSWQENTFHITSPLSGKTTGLHKRPVIFSFDIFYDVSLNKMMTSSNGNIFRVIDPFCGGLTGHRWIPPTKADDAKLWCFLWSAPQQTAEQTTEKPVNWDTITLIVTSLKKSEIVSISHIADDIYKCYYECILYKYTPKIKNAWLSMLLNIPLPQQTVYFLVNAVVVSVNGFINQNQPAYVHDLGSRLIDILNPWLPC